MLQSDMFTAPDAPAPRQPGEHPIPDGADLGTCRSCGASIAWRITDAGKRMPLSLASARTDNTGERVAVSHFADCPQGSEWSRTQSATRRHGNL